MIIISPAGGICNRITALEAAYHLGKRLNQKCIVLWNLKDELNCSFQTLFQDIEGMRFITIKQADKAEPFWVIFRKFLSMSERLFFYDFNKNYFDKNCKKNIDAIFHECDNQKFLTELKVEKGGIIFLKDPYYSFYGELTYDVVKANFTVRDIANSIMDSRYPYIGIHMRGTDHEACKQHVKVDLYMEKVKKEIRINPEIRIYLATDEEGIRQQFIKEFGDRIVYNKNTVFNRNSSDGIIGGLVDLLCLSKTNKMYGSFASTFSLYAASIHQIPLKVCINGKWGSYRFSALNNIDYISEKYIDFEEG